MNQAEQHVSVLTEPWADNIPLPPKMTELFGQSPDLFIGGRAFFRHRQRFSRKISPPIFLFAGRASTSNSED